MKILIKMGMRKLIIMLAALLWMIQPCYAAPATHANSAAKKHSHKIHKPVKSARKKTGNVNKIKSATKKSKKTRRKKVHPPSTSANVHVLLNQDRTIQSNLPAYLMNASELRLTNMIYKIISSLRYSSYKLGGTHIDTSRGVYVVDCSSYVDHILSTAFPRAYASLVNWSGNEKPTSDDYYHYFANLWSKSYRYWNPVGNIENLRPGDVLVFRNTSTSGYERGGHVMIVMDKPKKDAGIYEVRVSDAAPSGHSKDTRLPHTSGIGIGTLMLKANPDTSQPSAYAWKLGAQWKHNVAIAMARPNDLIAG